MSLPALRRARLLARFVLAWFVLAIGAAIASPIIRPVSMELICSGAGAMKVIVKTDGGVTDGTSHTLDCPLCANIGSPPPASPAVVEPPCPLSYALRPIPAAHIAWLTAAPPPGRGPPLFS